MQSATFANDYFADGFLDPNNKQPTKGLLTAGIMEDAPVFDISPRILSFQSSQDQFPIVRCFGYPERDSWRDLYNTLKQWIYYNIMYCEYC